MAPKKEAKQTPATSARSRKRPGGTSLISTADVRRTLKELGDVLAPNDVRNLLADEENLRARAAGTGEGRLGLLREQLLLALDMLGDHMAGRCPQIPYRTIALLAAAVHYFADDLDMIPDFLPRVGELDDGLVMAMAFHAGADGIRRYCHWKGIDPEPLVRQRKTPPPRRRAQS